MGQIAAVVIGPGWSGVSHRLTEVAAGFDGQSITVVASPLERDVSLGALRPLLGDPTGSATADLADHHGAADAVGATLGDRMLVIDDGHELDEQSIRTLAALADQGRSVVVGHRPSDREVLGALDDVVARVGHLERIGPLDEDDLAARLAVALDRAVDSDHLSDLHGCSGGLVGIAFALLDENGQMTDDPGGLEERVEAELRRAGEPARRVAEVLAMGSQPPDEVIWRSAEISEAELAGAASALERAGLTATESLQLVPAIRDVVRAGLGAADRRAVNRRLATALIARGGEAIEAAEHLLAAGTTGEEAASVYARAGDNLRFGRSEAALGWYDEAVAAGAPPTLVGAGRAEALAFAGRRPEGDASLIDVGSGPATEGANLPAERGRLLAVRAAEAYRDGRLGRSRELYDGIEAHPVLTSDSIAGLAVPALVGLGLLADARSRIDREADPLDTRADVVLCLGRALVEHSTDPRSSAPLFVEAAEALERVDLDVVLPESPHALAALCLSLTGDLPAAESLLHRATAAGAGGPAFEPRHRLVMAWLHLRSARYDLPTNELGALPVERLDGRDQLLHASVRAGLARRSGDVPALRAAWAQAEPVLLRGVGDLFQLEPLAELILAAARLRQRERARPVLEALESAVHQVGDARAWTIPAAWLEVQLAVEDDDAERALAAGDRLTALEPATGAQAAVAAAAPVWGRVLVDQIEPDEVTEVATELAGAHLPWEASRLAGQAAVRIQDAAAARRLLEQARTFHHDPDSPSATVSSDAGLTARELDVARYVLDGLTYREIGAQLYISPKTVEHHVARIRRKIQAGSRAEMLAGLRALFSEQGEGETG